MKIETATDSVIIPNEELEHQNSTDQTKNLTSGSHRTTPEHSSEDVVLDIEETSSDENTTHSAPDTPDGSNPVYRSTTESLSSSTEDDEKKNTSKGLNCCCSCITEKYRQIKTNMSNFSTRQWKTFIALFFGTLASSLSVCLFPPFFPRLAESKGETATMYGIVIGTNCLTAFIVTPLIARRLNKIGVNFAFVIGSLCSGACCAISGFLEYFPGDYRFFVVAVVIRICHATANALVITSTIAFIASEFPTSVAFLFSLTRATMNLAQMVGPVLGGAMHGIGGFKMPFFILGGTQMLITPFCGAILPSFIGANEKKKTTPLWGVVAVPGIWVSFVTFVFSTMSNGFISITLEPCVLRRFSLTPLYVGLLFGLKDGANCIASPIWGWICDRIDRAKILIICGSVLAIMSFLLLGPFPGLPIPYEMPVVVLALLLNGFGIGGQQVAGVISAMRDAVTAGFPDEAETHAFVAGLWSSLSGAGRFISRSGSGFLVDRIGFRNTSAIVTGLHICVFLTTTIYMAINKKIPANVGSKSLPADACCTTPTEPITSKSESSAIPIFREDLEDSFLLCSSSASRRRGSLWKGRVNKNLPKEAF